jgi:beta-glucosidase
LLDNFEWALGFKPKFGLHSVDHQTFARHAKPSASWYRDVARANALVNPASWKLS